MYHYVYYSYEQWGRGYIGVRSCHCLPEEDCYFGSYRDKTFSPTEKIIISNFESRQGAEKAEKTLQEFFSVVKNPHFANQAINLLVGFSRLGAKSTVEHREKTRLANLGSKNPNYGKPRSLETRKKQSAALKGRQFSPETLEKMKRSQKKNRKPIALEHLESGVVHKFDSINEAADVLGLNVGNVSNVYTGRQKTTGGFRLKSK
jgi:hypothetical protein